jgi:hypothetical protein
MERMKQLGCSIPDELERDFDEIKKGYPTDAMWRQARQDAMARNQRHFKQHCFEETRRRFDRMPRC